MQNLELIKSYKLNSQKKIEMYRYLTPKKNGKNILIIGAFHGEEPQGFWAIDDYFFKNSCYKNINVKNNVYIIPCLNPDGMEKNIRQNSNGVDLNRNFPTENWKRTPKESEYYGGNFAGSEDETKFTVELIENIKFDLILTLHSPYAIVNYDGPSKQEAEKLSELTGYPVQKDIGYPTPGSFGTYCGVERNIKTITLEFDDNQDCETIIKKSKKVFDFLLGEY